MLAMSWTHLRGQPGSGARPEARRVLGPPLVDEVLGDGRAVGLVRDHDPGAQVEQDAEPAEDREQGERQRTRVGSTPK